jgi:hypothetical protein
LAFGPVLRSARLKWLCAGLALNFKVYLIAPVVGQLVRRKWTVVEGMLLAAVGVYLLTWWLLGQGSPALLARNLTSYSGGFSAKQILDLWYASSLVPMRTLVDSNFPIEMLLSSEQVNAIRLFVMIYTYATVGLAALALAATWLRPEVVPNFRVLALCLIVPLSLNEAGGYTEILLLLSMFQERWRGWLRPLAIFLAYVLCVPEDFFVMTLPPVVRDSFLGGHYVIATYGVGIIMVLRPVITMLICMLLSVVTLGDVWRDIARQGWKHRWRFRRDWPILPGMQRPEPGARPVGQN